MSPPILEDLDGDDELEVILTKDSDGHIYVWKADGTGYSQPDGKFALNPAGAKSQFHSLAVGDVVPGTTGVEILQAIQKTGATCNKVYCFNGIDGSVIWTGTVPSPCEFLSTPVIGDVDDDGDLEVVVTRRTHFDEDEGVIDKKGGVFVFDGLTGALEDSSTSVDYWFASGEDLTQISPILANLDGDDELEIVVGGGEVGDFDASSGWKQVVRAHVFDLSGGSLTEATATDSIPIPGRKFETSATIASPAAADLDGDSEVEFLTVSNSAYLSAWGWKSGNGTAVVERGWPQQFADEPRTPLVADVDASGDLEMVVQDRAGLVHVLSLPGDTTGARLEWPEYAHDARNTSNYGTSVSSLQMGGPVVQLGSGEEPLHAAIANLSPNPFNPMSEVVIWSPGNTKISLRVFDAGGRLVRTLANGVLERGMHQVTWDGRNASGGEAATGIYFYRLEAGDAVEVRKIVLLK